jgi:hypothetical protein
VHENQYSGNENRFTPGPAYKELTVVVFSTLCSSLQWSQQSLVRWATPQLHDIEALDQMVDPAMEGLYPAKSLSRFADAIALCVQVDAVFCSSLAISVLLWC